MSFTNIALQDFANILSRRTVPQLKSLAKTSGVKCLSKMKK